MHPPTPAPTPPTRARPGCPRPSGTRSAPTIWPAGRRRPVAAGTASALSTLRGRAADEGWRRADQPWAGPRGLDRDDEGLALEESVDGDLEQIGLGELSVVAFQRMMRAVLHGDAMAALRWRRLHQALGDEHRRLARLVEQEEERRLAAGRRQVRAATDALLAETRVMEAEIRRLDAGRGLPTPPDDLDDLDDLDGVFPPSPGAAFTLPGLPVGKAPVAPP